MVSGGFSLLEFFCKCFVCKGVVIKCRPVLKPCLLGRIRCGRYLFDFFRPVVWSFNYFEHGRIGRIINLPQFDFDEEEAYLLIGMLIQPLDGLPVLIASPLQDPYHHRSIFAGCVGDYLAEVVVVCVLQLIFDD